MSENKEKSNTNTADLSRWQLHTATLIEGRLKVSCQTNELITTCLQWTLERTSWQKNSMSNRNLKTGRIACPQSCSCSCIWGKTQLQRGTQSLNSSKCKSLSDKAWAVKEDRNGQHSSGWVSSYVLPSSVTQCWEEVPDFKGNGFLPVGSCSRFMLGRAP